MLCCFSILFLFKYYSAHVSGNCIEEELSMLLFTAFDSVLFKFNQSKVMVMENRYFVYEMRCKKNLFAK